jgi:hypothetical protein
MSRWSQNKGKCILLVSVKWNHACASTEPHAGETYIIMCVYIVDIILELTLFVAISCSRSYVIASVCGLSLLKCFEL